MAIFEFTLKQPDSELSTFAQGDVTIVGTEGTVTSTADPRYSMMIFLSITQFLGNLRYFFCEDSQRSSRKCELHGIDGSFLVYILRGYTRELDYMIGIEVFGNRVSREPLTQFIREFWQGVEPFVNQYRTKINPNDNPHIVSYLDKAMQEFAEAFADILNGNLPPI